MVTPKKDAQPVIVKMAKDGLFLTMVTNILGNSNTDSSMVEVIITMRMVTFTKGNGYSLNVMVMAHFYGKMGIAILVNIKTINDTVKAPMFLQMVLKKKEFGRMVRLFERYFQIRYKSKYKPSIK